MRAPPPATWWWSSWVWWTGSLASALRHVHTAVSRSLRDDNWCISAVDFDAYSRVLRDVFHMHLKAENCWLNLTQLESTFSSDNSPVPPGISCGSISNCFDPHGHSVSTTNRIKLLWGIFCTLKGLSQPEEWQFVNFPCKIGFGFEWVLDSITNLRVDSPLMDCFGRWSSIDPAEEDIDPSLSRMDEHEPDLAQLSASALQLEVVAVGFDLCWSVYFVLVSQFQVWYLQSVCHRSVLPPHSRHIRPASRPRSPADRRSAVVEMKSPVARRTRTMSTWTWRNTWRSTRPVELDWCDDSLHCRDCRDLSIRLGSPSVRCVERCDPARASP